MRENAGQAMYDLPRILSENYADVSVDPPAGLACA